MAIRAMLLARMVYLGLIIYALASNRIGSAIFSGVVFLGALLLVRLARTEREPDYYMLDASVSLLFSGGLIISFLDLWMITNPYYGFDKLFHIAAGAILGWFAAVWLRRRVTDAWAYRAAIVLFALAVGGAWEVYEWFFTVLPPPLYAPTLGYADTMMDMVADTLGGALLALLFWRRKK